MPESAKMQGIGTYANLCLTVIAGCLIYLCYRSSITDTSPEKPKGPTRVVIAGIASDLKTPIPCKFMYKKQSSDAALGQRWSETEWVDEGTLGVHFKARKKSPAETMNEIFYSGILPNTDAFPVQVVAVASNIKHALPTKTKQEKPVLFGSAPSNDGAIAVRLVGIERPQGRGNWHAIPVRGPAPMSGESGGMIGSYPIEVETGVYSSVEVKTGIVPLSVNVR